MPIRPQMKLNPDVDDIFAFRHEDFELVEYQAHPSIPALGIDMGSDHSVPS